MTPLSDTKTSTEPKSDTRGMYRVWIWFSLGSIPLWIGVYAKLAWHPIGSFSMLVLLAGTGLILAVVCARPIIRLESRETAARTSKLIAYAAIGAMVIVGVLHQRGMIYFPSIYVVLPLAITAAGIVLGALVAETRHRVSVYATSRGYVYRSKP